MIALDGQEDVQKMVREIKGMLPQAGRARGLGYPDRERYKAEDKYHKREDRDHLSFCVERRIVPRLQDAAFAS